VFREHADRIAVVLLDMTMPRMGGEDALREMRSIAPHVRVILSSGYDEDETVARLSREGPISFIAKPYQRADLLAKIRELLPAPDH